ncbi:MAG: hypothetical protein WAT79_12115 [Saprospiraceae bacterium]
MKVFRLLILIPVLLTLTIHGIGQGKSVSKKDNIKALNAFVLYVNEVNNYLPIINSLMVDYNMKLNKYVDLPSHETSLFSNALFPNNLFDDVIFHHSPNALYQTAKQLAQTLPANEKDKLLTISKAFQENTSYINTSRFEVERLLTTLDLTKRENVSKLYDKMETVSTAFKQSKKLQYELEYQLKATYKNIVGSGSQSEKISKSLEDIYQLSRLLIEAVYENNQEELEDLVKSHAKAVEQCKLIDMKDYNGTFWVNPVSQAKIKAIVNKASELNSEVKKYINYDPIPEKYNLYGRNYYFYNHSFLVKLNRFGMGIAAENNEILLANQVDKMLYFELPYDYKVIYPRVIREEMFLPSSVAFIQTLPRKVQEREVVKADRLIQVDKQEIEFEIYDHKIIDNDIVSILFNGEWVLENFKISDKKHKFRIKLNESGVNYLLLHAIDEGRRPPATIAIAYYANGMRNQIILNSDTIKSELIEIVLKKD